jgi:hypothetical protein
MWNSIAPTMLPTLVFEVFISSKALVKLEKFHSFGSSSALYPKAASIFFLASAVVLGLPVLRLEAGLESGFVAAFAKAGGLPLA